MCFVVRFIFFLLLLLFSFLFLFDYIDFPVENFHLFLFSSYAMQ